VTTWMKKSLAWLLCLPLWASAANVNIQQWMTAESLDVYLVQQHDLPMVDIQLIFPAGSASDGDAYGLASLGASLIGEGTDDYEASEIARTFANTGAIFNSQLDRDRVIFSLRSVSDFEPLTRSFRLMIDLFAKVKIRSPDFNRARAAQLVEIQYNEVLPPYIASTLMFEQLYGKDPYGHPRLGTAETVQNIKLSQVASFYKKYYVPQNAVLVFVGDINDVAARQFAAQLSRAFPKAEQKMESFPKLDLREDESTRKQVMKSSQTQIQKGLLVMAENDPDRAALSVFNEILGGSAESRMMKIIRGEKGLAYGAYSYFNPYRRAGPFIMSVQTRAAEAKKVERVMNDLLVSLVKEGPTPEEFQAAKKRLLGQFSLLLPILLKLWDGWPFTIILSII
jgi:zinc protease